MDEKRYLHIGTHKAGSVTRRLSSYRAAQANFWNELVPVICGIPRPRPRPPQRSPQLLPGAIDMRYSASTTRPRSAVKYIDLHNLQPHSTAAAAPNRLAQHSPSSPDGSHQSEPISEPKMSPVSLLNGVLLTFNVLCLVAAGSVSLIVYLRRVARLHGHGPHQVLQPAQHQHHLANITSRPVYQNGNDEEDDNDNNNDEEKQCLKLHYSPVNTLINNHVAIAKEFPFEDTVV